MSAHHTPGPWLVRMYGGEVDSIYSVGGIKIVETDSGHYPPYIADAHLIAAAPELLEALKVFVAEYVELVASGDAGNWDVEQEDKVKAARAAISKATGGAS